MLTQKKQNASSLITVMFSLSPQGRRYVSSLHAKPLFQTGLCLGRMNTASTLLAKRSPLASRRSPPANCRLPIAHFSFPIPHRHLRPPGRPHQQRVQRNPRLHVRLEPPPAFPQRPHERDDAIPFVSPSVLSQLVQHIDIRDAVARIDSRSRY